MRFIVSALVLSLFISCSSDNRILIYPETAGLTYGESEQEFGNTFISLRKELQYADYRIEKEIDFKEYAESYGRRSREAKLLLLSKPELEIPLIKENPEVGIEFPTRMLTYVDRDKYVLVAYNSPEYLNRIYGLNNVAGKVTDLEASLSDIVSKAIGIMPVSNVASNVGSNVLTYNSENTFNVTFNSLHNAIKDHSEFKEVKVVDHQFNARAIGEDIPANKVLMFSTGEMEADLIDRFQLSSVDLPIRILVWEDETGTVQISLQNLEILVYRHKAGTNEIAKFDEIRRLLQSMVYDATGLIE